MLFIFLLAVLHSFHALGFPAAEAPVLHQCHPPERFEMLYGILQGTRHWLIRITTTMVAPETQVQLQTRYQSPASTPHCKTI